MPTSHHDASTKTSYFMIPYFQQPQLNLGPLTIHAFGVLVAGAVMLGVTILRRRAAEQGLGEREVSRFVSWTLVGGFAGAHLLDRLFYFPAQTLNDPLSLLRFWEGLSSFGGFVGGTTAALPVSYTHLTLPTKA